MHLDHLDHRHNSLRKASHMLALAGTAQALVKLGPVVAGISGSIGGTTFARNRGGSYARNRTVPINPSTSRQNAVRALMGNLAQVWTNTLNDVQRAAWELYAANVTVNNKLGEARNLTGQNMFIRANSLLIQCGEARVDDGPTNFTVGPTITPTFNIVPASDEIGITDLGTYDPDTDGAVNIFVSMGTPQNGGVQFFRSPFTLQQALNIPNTAALPVADAAAPYPFEAGQAIFIRTAVVTPDGRVGVPTVQRFLVA